MVTGGRLGDIFGRRRMFLFGVVVFGLSSLIIGVAPNETVLVAFRAIQGVGAAFMMPATLSIIPRPSRPSSGGMAIGTWAGVSAMGARGSALCSAGSSPSRSAGGRSSSSIRRSR